MVHLTPIEVQTFWGIQLFLGEILPSLHSINDPIYFDLFASTLVQYFTCLNDQIPLIMMFVFFKNPAIIVLHKQNILYIKYCTYCYSGDDFFLLKIPMSWPFPHKILW